MTSPWDRFLRQLGELLILGVCSGKIVFNRSEKRSDDGRVAEVVIGYDVHTSQVWVFEEEYC